MKKRLDNYVFAGVFALLGLCALVAVCCGAMHQLVTVGLCAMMTRAGWLAD